MAPNLKKFSIQTLDLTDIQLGRYDKTPAPPVTDERDNISASYWDWTSPVQDVLEPRVDDDLFSIDHIQSNLIQALSSDVVVSPNPAPAEYWAERDEASPAPPFSPKQPLHSVLPACSLAASDLYWNDSHDPSESDAYWMGASVPRGIKHRPSPRPLLLLGNSHRGRQQGSQQLLAGNISNRENRLMAEAVPLYRYDTSKQREEDSEEYWFWGHQQTDSDRYWSFDTPTTISAF